MVLCEAERFTRALEPLAYAPAYDHDLGFLIYCSYGNAYCLTGKEVYRRAILSAADSLAQLFVLKVGTILLWPRNVSLFGGYNTIMDNMMNLEMLFWAAENGGSSRLKEIAVSQPTIRCATFSGLILRRATWLSTIRSWENCCVPARIRDMLTLRCGRAGRLGQFTASLWYIARRATGNTLTSFRK